MAPANRKCCSGGPICRAIWRRPENPLGGRAMYLGSSLYAHGSNEPWTIVTTVVRRAAA